MFRKELLIIIALFAFCTVPTVTAQTAQDVTNKIMPIATAPVITGTASTERLRFTAPSSVVQMHLQVYADSGQLLFDVSSRGNVLDWTLQDSGGARLVPGSYLSVVTVKSLSGKLSQRIGAVLVQDKQVELQRVEATQLSAAQQQAVGPIEENSALSILKAGEADATTVVANDGKDGQLIRDHGALSFRLGDFFSGDDKEQMRLTEEGNLGIGTDKPQAKLDVAGDIRASGAIRTAKGIEFEDGTVQTTGSSGRKDKDGNILPAASGSGSQNKLAKWSDNAGTLGDSLMSESGQVVQLNGNGLQLTAPPNTSVDTNLLYLNSTNGTTGVLAGNVPSFGANNGPFFAMRGNTYTAIGGGSQRGLFAISAGNIAGATGRQGSILFNTGPDQVRMTVKPSGDVGIGTETPAARLDVAGNVRLSGANSGLIFPDGTSMTTAASGGTMSGTSIVNAVNDPATVGTISDARLSPSVARLNGTNNFIGNENVTGNISVSGDPSGLTGNIGAAGQMSATTAFFGTITGNNLAVDSDTLIVNPSTRHVGIGTNAPGEKLSVAGTVQSTSGGFKFPDGSVQTTAVSETFTISSGTDVEINPNGTTTGTPILHLDLPPGNGHYLVFAMVELENRADLFAQDNRRNVLCDIVPSSQGTSVIGGSGDTNIIVMNLHGLITQVNGVTLSCRARSGGTDRSFVHTGFRRLTAMRIGNITNE